MTPKLNISRLIPKTISFFVINLFLLEFCVNDLLNFAARGNTFDSALEQIIKMTPDEASLTLREADLALDSRQKASKKINEITDKLFKYWFIDYNFPDENNEPYQLNFGDIYETLF